MTARPHIGFVGAGSMAGALARGFRSADLVGRISAHDPDHDRLTLFCQDVRATPVPTNADVATASDVVFLAVKPQDINSALEALSGTANLVASIAAGISIARLQAGVPSARVIRIMPNTPGLIGEMAAGFARGSTATAEDTALVERLLAALGVAIELDEPDLDAVTALSASGPAFFARIMEAFIDAGAQEGLSIDVARQLTLQTAKGTAALLQARNWEPEELVEMVSSVRGTTVAGRAVLEGSDLREVITRTVAAAAARSRELAAE